MPVLNQEKLKGITGAWLVPKARLKRCEACQCRYASNTGRSPYLDATTAEVSDTVGVVSVGSQTLTLGLLYSSHLADGTNTILSTILGSGWTHTYNSYLVERSGDVFWIPGNHEVVSFANRGGSFETSTGQFMKIEFTGTNTAEVTQKDGTVHRFGRRSVPWHPGGDVFTAEAIIDPDTRTTTFDYTPAGLLARVIDSFANTLEFEYDGGDRLTHVSAAGRDAWFEYASPTGQLSAVVLPGGERIEYQYNFVGQMTAKKFPSGAEYRVGYNPQGRADRMWDPDDALIVSQSSSTGWTPDHQESLRTGEMHYLPGITVLTDGNGEDWTFEYDNRGHITVQTDPVGNTTLNTFDQSTLFASAASDPNGNLTEIEYDDRGNRTLVRDAEGNETRFEYEPVHNNLIKRTDPGGDISEFIYDAYGNLVEEIDPLIEHPIDATVRYEYYPAGASAGLLWKSIDRNGNVTEWAYNPDGSTQMMVDPSGAVTSFIYDAFGNNLSTTLHNDSGDQVTSYVYDERDRLLTTTDALGHTTRYEYSADGDRTAKYSCWIAPGKFRTVTRMEYDTRGRLIRTTEDDGGLNRTTQFVYDGNGNVVLSINPNGVITESHFDVLNRLERRVFDPGGLAIEQSYLYDAVGNTTAQTGPNGNTILSEYDSLNRLTRQIDALGYSSTFNYAAPGGGGGGGCGCGTPGSSLVKCITDQEGKVTLYEYDALDRRVREIRQVGEQGCGIIPDSDDSITTIVYDPNGNPITLTDPNGNTTTSTYTARNELESSTNGCGETTTFEYDAAGNLIREFSPNGSVVVYEYDLLDQPVFVHDSIGDITTMTYDCAGNEESISDALGRITTVTYDNLNRQVSVTDPLNQPTTLLYDPVGNLIGVTDRMGNQIESDYDAANRRTVLRTWPDSGAPPAMTTSAYDNAGNLLSLTDANGNTTSYGYDVANRPVSMTFADGTTTQQSYNGVGNLLSREDSMGQGVNTGNITTYSYDDLHRLEARVYSTGLTESFTHDAAGRMLTAGNDHSHIGYTYDCADRILTSTQADIPQTYAHTVGYSYNAVANTRTITYPGGKTVVESRDLRHRLDTVTQDAAPSVDYNYDPANRLQTKAYANGTKARYSYNDNDWVTHLRHEGPGGLTTFAGFAYTYDLEGNQRSAENLQTVIPYDNAKPATQSETYGYDDMYHLVDFKRGRWVAGEVPEPRRNRTWQIDNVHNWTGFGITDLQTGENAAYCNSVNQVNEYDDPSNDGPPAIPDDDELADDFMLSPCLESQLNPTSDRTIDLLDIPNTVERGSRGADKTGDGAFDINDLIRLKDDYIDGGNTPPTTGFNRRHDKNGNLVDDGTREYFYDHDHSPVETASLRADNRLTMVKDKGTGDTLGQYRYDALGRRIRKQAPGTPDLSTVFVYTTGWQAIEEYEEGNLARVYVYGDRIDEVVSMDRTAEADRYYYHENVLGSTIALTDGAGTAVERYAYDAYGSPSVSDGSANAIANSVLVNPYLFTGRRFDTESTLFYYRTRYLDSVAGRFITRDTIGIWGDPANSGNGYTYAANSPSAAIDPRGLATTKFTRLPETKLTCTKQQRQVLKKARSEACKLAKRAEHGLTRVVVRKGRKVRLARQQLKRHADPNDGRRPTYRWAAAYLDWFGKYDKSRFNGVISNLRHIKKGLCTDTLEFDCCCSDADKGTVAFVEPDDGKRKIWVCPPFWGIQPTPTAGSVHSQAGIVLHEMSHDHDNVLTNYNDNPPEVYREEARLYRGGKSLNNQQLSEDTAWDNADSYRVFATRAYFHNGLSYDPKPKK
jgi:RHS repeat-associated protein